MATDTLGTSRRLLPFGAEGVAPARRDSREPLHRELKSLREESARDATAEPLAWAVTYRVDLERRGSEHAADRPFGRVPEGSEDEPDGSTE